jgi:hypothetical protein
MLPISCLLFSPNSLGHNSVSILLYNVDISYTIDCHGMQVNGSGGAQVCASALGLTVCADCTAVIAGTAGIVHTADSGVHNAELQELLCFRQLNRMD